MNIKDAFEYAQACMQALGDFDFNSAEHTLVEDVLMESYLTGKTPEQAADQVTFEVGLQRWYGQQDDRWNLS